MRKPFVLSLLCVLGALSLFFWGFNPQSPPSPAAESRYILLIDNDTGTFLMQLRKGMQEAAAMQGAQLSVSIVAEDPAAQAAELSASAPTAVLLLLSDPSPMLAALEAEGIPALVINQTLRGYVCVVSDDQKAGEALVQYALTLAMPDQILLLTDAQDPRADERAKGGAELTRRSGIQTLPWTDGMMIPKGFRAIVALSSRATLALTNAKSSGTIAVDCQVLGIDPGDTKVQALEKGWGLALAIDNPYAMGYVSIEKAQQLAAGTLPPSVNLCAAAIIHTDNMYLSENVKLIFPLLQ